MNHALLGVAAAHVFFFAWYSTSMTKRHPFHHLRKILRLGQGCRVLSDSFQPCSGVFLIVVMLSLLPGTLLQGQDEAVELARSREAAKELPPHERQAFDLWQKEAQEQQKLLEKAVRKGVVAELVSPKQRARFVEYALENGEVWVATELSLKDAEDGDFVVISDGLKFPKLFLLRGEDLVLNIADYAARWSLPAASSTGKKSGKLVSSDPFLAGQAFLYFPVFAQTQGASVVIKNVSARGPEIEAVWSMDEHGLRVECRVTCRSPASPGSRVRDNG